MLQTVVRSPLLPRYPSTLKNHRVDSYEAGIDVEDFVTNGFNINQSTRGS